jgi:hypothetical protein
MVTLYFIWKIPTYKRHICHAKHQYLVDCPLLSRQAWILRWKLSTKQQTSSSVTEAHSCLTRFTRSSRFLGRGLRRTESWSLAQRCSIGFRSGELPDQSVHTLGNCFLMASMVTFAVCAGVPSCMKTTRFRLGKILELLAATA